VSARVLVTGAAGFLGWWLAAELRRRGHEVHGTSRDGAGLPPAVLAHRLELDDGGAAGAALLRAVRPAAVFHLAALSDPDACAREPARAETVNAVAPARMAAGAAELGAWFVQASTDLVFDGTRAPYAEHDPPAPLGPYMASKAAAEAAVRAVAPGALVARVALLYGLAGGRKGCFTGVLLERLARGEAVTLFQDQIRTPLLVQDAAELLADLLPSRPAGLLHLGGPERVSRHAHGVALARAFGLDPAGCRPGSIDDLPGLAPRPRDVSLVTGRLAALAGRTGLGVEAGCRRAAAAATGGCGPASGLGRSRP
jgi:dTDP-4-dehydrorhamnose reductase